MELNLHTILLILAGVCFVLEAFAMALGTFKPKWWALGVAFYLFSLIP